MSFINANTASTVYAPGYFLAHEECTRKTMQIAQSGATTLSNGTKYVKAGTLYSVTTGTGTEAVTDYIGFVYEDVDVTTGNMPGSVVTKGEVVESKLPAVLTSAQKTALEAKGFVFVAEPSVVRPY